MLTILRGEYRNLARGRQDNYVGLKSVIALSAAKTQRTLQRFAPSTFTPLGENDVGPLLQSRGRDAPGDHALTRRELL